MMYTGIRKINATIFTDVEKTTTTTIVKTFKTCGYTIDECRKNITKKTNEYVENPFVKEVVPISEYFEN